MVGGRTHAARWLVALCVVLLAACTSPGDDDAGSESTAIPEAATLLRVATADWPTCLNPVTCADGSARSLVLQHVLPKLMEVDPQGGYVPSPVLAGPPDVEVDPASGEQTLTFTLAEDARWQDGRPMTSSDVTATWLAHRDTPGARDVGHSLIVGVDDRDPSVAVVTLSQSWADWPELFGGHEGWLVQADALGGTTDVGGAFDEFLPFGAGPYELVSFDEESLVLVARESYWAQDRHPTIDQVRVDHVPGLSEEGSDVPGGADVVLAGRVLDDPPEGFEQRRAASTEIVGLMLDRRTAPLGSPPVRAAVDEAVDRRGALDLLPGGDVPSLVTCLAGLPQQPACGGEHLPEPGVSDEAVTALLDADGWAVDPATGLRARPGLALATPVTHEPAVAGADAVADAVAERLADFGFTTGRQVVEGAAWRQRGRGEGTGIGVFAAPLGTAGQVAALYGCGPEGMNPLGWCEPELQDLVDQLLRAPDDDERQRIQQAISERAAEARSWLPLYQRTTPSLVRTDRVGVAASRPLGSGPLGALYDFERTD